MFHNRKKERQIFGYIDGQQSDFIRGNSEGIFPSREGFAFEKDEHSLDRNILLAIVHLLLTVRVNRVLYQNSVDIH